MTQGRGAAEEIFAWIQCRRWGRGIKEALWVPYWLAETQQHRSPLFPQRTRKGWGTVHIELRAGGGLRVVVSQVPKGEGPGAPVIATNSNSQVPESEGPGVPVIVTNSNSQVPKGEGPGAPVIATNSNSQVPKGEGPGAPVVATNSNSQVPESEGPGAPKHSRIPPIPHKTRNGWGTRQ